MKVYAFVESNGAPYNNSIVVPAAYKGCAVNVVAVSFVDLDAQNGEANAPPRVLYGRTCLAASMYVKGSYLALYNGQCPTAPHLVRCSTGTVHRV